MISMDEMRKQQVNRLQLEREELESEIARLLERNAEHEHRYDALEALLETSIKRSSRAIEGLREQVQFWHDKHDDSAIEHGRLRAALEFMDANCDDPELYETACRKYGIAARKALAKKEGK